MILRAATLLRSWLVKSGMSAESAVKRQCTMKRIGTHNGTFHCDEALACYMLRQLPEYCNADVIRTRDPATLDSCDIVVDVGAVYDPDKNRFDHHQRSFAETMHSLRPEKKWTTKLSSAGLIYLHFGHDVLAQIMHTQPHDKITKIVYDKVYELFVEAIDAVDNGVNPTDEKPRYAVTTSLSARVGHLNPSWNEASSEDDVKARFHKAMEMVGAEFVDRVKYYNNSWWPARTLVEKALSDRHQVDPSGEVLSLDQGGCPWKDHLINLEEELSISPSIKFVLYSDTNGAWRVQCVPVELSSFDNRLSLLEEWRGVRDDELSKLSGIPGCIFVHASGFIGGNKTYEGALELARRTLSGKPRLDS